MTKDQIPPTIIEIGGVFMNKIHNIRYGFMKCIWTFQQWQVLMFPSHPYGGETYKDCDVEDLRWWFFEYLNNFEGYFD